MEVYKLKEQADLATRDSTGALNVEDSYSNSGYRSGKSFSMAAQRRRKTIQNMAGDAYETSSRVSGNRSQQQGDHRVNRLKGDKSIFDGYINKEIDYFGRCDLVKRAREATNYVPLALRDQKSLSRLC